MTPEMQRALVDLSVFYDPDPANVFQRVLEAISAQYGGATAAVNLLDGDRVRFHAFVNPHPVLRRLGSLLIGDTY